MASDPERHKRTVATLAASYYDAVICSSPTDVLLLSGYWPVMGSSLAIFTSSGDATVIVPEDEVELAEKTSSAEIVPYKPAGLHMLESPLQLLKEPLRSVVTGLSLLKARIGIQLKQGVQPSSYAVCTEFRASLLELLLEIQPRATYEGCDELLELMKATKTAKELELMQTAARVRGHRICRGRGTPAARLTRDRRSGSSAGGFRNHEGGGSPLSAATVTSSVCLAQTRQKPAQPMPAPGSGSSKKAIWS